MKEQFIVAAGGTGARTTEALVHVCASGLGPDRLHLLIVDTDDTNGNLARLKGTLADYRRCREWAWGGADQTGLDLFGTEIHAYYLTDALEFSDYGIRGQECTPGEYAPVLDLFFTEEEQRSTGEHGFLARPNLGSLLMGKHLLDAFTERSIAGKRFLEALRNSMIEVPNDQSREQDSFVVVGSVFGGTGASVIPIIGDCILRALRLTARSSAHAALEQQWKRIQKSAIMMLPYFQPQEPPADEATTETVDPSRPRGHQELPFILQGNRGVGGLQLGLSDWFGSSRPASPKILLWFPGSSKCSLYRGTRCLDRSASLVPASKRRSRRGICLRTCAGSRTSQAQ